MRIKALVGAALIFGSSTAALAAGNNVPGVDRYLSNPGREQAVRCRLVARDDGWHAEPTGDQGSHVLTSLLGADALARVPAGEGELAAGERVQVDLLR